jgi:hypothetical protein
MKSQTARKGLRGKGKGFGALCALLFALCAFAPANAAVGDVVAACSSIASGAALDVQPGAGVEWAIHNIFFEYDVELQRYDGSNTVATAQFTGPDWQNISPVIHVNNTNRIRLKNLHGSLAKLICYDGVVTK